MINREIIAKGIHILGNKKARIVLGSVVFVLFSTFLIGNQATTRADYQKESNQIAVKLNDINVQLNKLSSHPKVSGAYESALNAIRQDVRSMNESVLLMAKSEEVKNVSSQILTLKEDINSGLRDLKKSVSSGMDNKELLSEDVLPFQVIAIDVIAGQPYVSVDYDKHIIPIAVGDFLASWRVNNVDYDLKVAEFRNEKNQFVRVNLQEV